MNLFTEAACIVCFDFRYALDLVNQSKQIMLLLYSKQAATWPTGVQVDVKKASMECYHVAGQWICFGGSL